MNECQEIAVALCKQLQLPAINLTMDEARAIIRAQMPDETVTVIDNVAEAFMRQSESLHRALARHGLRTVVEQHPRFGTKVRLYSPDDRDLGWWSAPRGWELVERLDAGEQLKPAVLEVNQKAATALLQSLGADEVVHRTARLN